MKNNNRNVEIIKASGEREPFSEEKLRSSLLRAGASKGTAEKIVRQIERELKPGMRTSVIYKDAFSMLRKEERPTAARYSLKKAIGDLGPSGHPFEKLVARLLESEGFSVEVGKILEGACVSHEVDVIAQKGNEYAMVECKFHNHPGIKSDVKTALYIHARFMDLMKVWEREPDHKGKTHEAWLVTNTKLTGDAVRYARCSGMKAVGWRYPRGEGLEIRIERAGLHPVTALTSLSTAQKRQLLAKGIVLCKELLENKEAFRMLGISGNKIESVICEIEGTCRLKR